MPTLLGTLLGTLLVTHSRGNHGGIAPTKIGESAKVE
ncbi:thioredoxin [Prochlorothrix hollandica]